MNIKKILKTDGAFAVVASIVLLAALLRRNYETNEVQYSIVKLSMLAKNVCNVF